MKKFLVLAVLGAFLAPTTAVFAQVEAPTGTFDISARCESMVTKATERLAHTSTRHQDNVDRMNASITKLEEVIAKGNELGLDTSALVTDLANLESTLADLSSDHQAVQDHLTTMAQVDCETFTAEEHDSLVETAKSLHKALKENVDVIKEIRLSIKAHVGELLEAIASLNSSETSS